MAKVSMINKGATFAAVLVGKIFIMTLPKTKIG
jgi:hypothetical protein